jgi:rubrerythrin
MPLPKLHAPIFELTLPSTKETIKYRPFLVKEQKILMLALEDNEQASVINAIKQIINNCSIEPAIDVDKLPIFDLEYFFVRLRAKSIGEKVDLRMRHPNGMNKLNESCSKETMVNLSLLEIEVSKKENHTDTIIIDEETGIGVKMKYPTMTPVNVEDAKTELDAATESIINSIDYIFDKENVYKKEDNTKQELVDFIDNLSQEQFTKLASFFETMPKLKHEVKWKCKGCGQEETVELEGMNNFFAF